MAFVPIFFKKFVKIYKKIQEFFLLRKIFSKILKYIFFRKFQNSKITKNIFFKIIFKNLEIYISNFLF